MPTPGGRERVDDFIARFSSLIGMRVPPLDADGFTQVQRGNATVGINVLPSKGFILFLAPILDVPQRNREELYRALLDLNYLRTEDAAFAIDRETDRIYLRALRSLDLLDFEGFCDLLEVVARVADDLQGKLRTQFGITR